ncbi:trigger factor protein (TF) C-terminus, partial [Paenibacillus sp. 453mf]
LEMFMSFSGQTEADLQNQMKGDAEKRVRNNLGCLISMANKKSTKCK